MGYCLHTLATVNNIAISMVVDIFVKLLSGPLLAVMGMVLCWARDSLINSTYLLELMEFFIIILNEGSQTMSMGPWGHASVQWVLEFNDWAQRCD